MPRFKLSFLLTVLVVNCIGQIQQPYLFSYMGTRRGLASDETSEIRQDAKGYMWVGTSNGLQRYDGRRFLTFRHAANNPGSIPNDEVKSLCMDKKNRLWMVCDDNRVGYFDVSAHIFHEVPVRFPTDVLKKATGTLSIDADGNLLLLLNSYTILSYNEKANEFSNDSNNLTLPKGWKPLSISIDQQNNYWIGCDSGLIRFNSRQKTFSYRGHITDGDAIIRSFSNLTNISYAYADKKGRCWVVSHVAGSPLPVLFVYEPAMNKLTNMTGQLRSMLKNVYHEITGIKEQNDGTVWIIGNNLLARLNESTHEFELLQSNLPGEFSIRYDEVASLFEDRENSLWACTNRGLYRFNPSGQVFNTVVNKRAGTESAYNSEVVSIAQAINGDILVSTAGDGIFAYDRNLIPVNASHINEFSKPGENYSYCIYQRSNGDICKGSRDGYLDIYHTATKRTEKIKPPVLVGNTIRQITEDRNGNLWLGTEKGQLVKWDALNGRFSLVQKFNGMITKLYIDSKADLWVCSSASGVHRVNTSTGSINAHYTSNGKEGRVLLGSGAVDILQYNDSLYLIASDGLNVLNIRNNSYTYFSKDNGLLSNSVTNIIKDRLGYVWVTTKPWLCSINLEKEVVTFYDERDGIQTGSFTTGSACLLHDGRIAIGTAHDMLVFDPAKAKENAATFPPDITISGFAVMNKWLSMDSINKLPYVELKSDQNSITIELSSLTYQSLYGFFYMLEGLDKDWRISPQQNQLTYNYLPPGNYTFKVMCKNGDAVPSKHITELKIKVRPVFWRTWWFYSLLVFAGIGLVYWFDKERMKRKEGLQKIRSEIAGNLHEEVNIALNNINILSEMARIKADSEPAKSKEYIEQIHDKSHNMIIAMDDMLWSLSPENDNMHKTVERMREYIESLQNRYGVSIEISVDKKVESQSLNMKLRHEALQLFKEGIKSLVQAGTKKCGIHLAIEKNILQFTMQFENANCDMQQLNNLLHRQDLEKNMRSIRATFNVIVHKTNSTFTLAIPVGQEITS